MHHLPILNISGPSGIGKSHLLQYLAPLGYRIILSTTTRPMRAGEQNGVDYEFLSQEEYEQALQETDDFFMDNFFLGHHYGTRRSALENVWTQALIPVTTIKLEVLDQFTATYPQTCHIFLTEGTPGLLQRRLEKRHPDDPQKVIDRLAGAQTELALLANQNIAKKFHHIIPIMDDSAETLALTLHQIALDHSKSL